MIFLSSPVAKPLQEALEDQLAPMRKLLAGMPNLATLPLGGLVVHAGLTLSALSSAAIPRYTIGLWPPMVIGILFFGMWVARRRRDWSTKQNFVRKPASQKLNR
jgi:hypothetical protein